MRMRFASASFLLLIMVTITMVFARPAAVMTADQGVPALLSDHLITEIYNPEPDPVLCTMFELQPSVVSIAAVAIIIEKESLLIHEDLCADIGVQVQVQLLEPTYSVQLNIVRLTKPVYEIDTHEFSCLEVSSPTAG